ncbi:hypothetical protein M3Y98_00240300 [Aphelenchoides besseyi]|nr:hypothetical protein M3Y98_00240300 [Aphelenchoides besseyi]
MDAVTTGLFWCIISTLLYGSAFVPLKGKNFGDGVYSLQLRSIVILLVGFVVFILNENQFFPVVMLGGSLWAIANLIVLPCVGQIGLGLTVLLYSFTNCLTNWIIGNYGFIGLTKARPPKNSILNYVGLIFLLLGGILMFFIKSDLKRPNLPTPTSQSSMTGMISNEKTDVLNQIEFNLPATGNQMVNISVERFNVKRILSVIGSLPDFHRLLYNQLPVHFGQSLSFCLSCRSNIFLNLYLDLLVIEKICRCEKQSLQEVRFPHAWLLFGASSILKKSRFYGTKNLVFLFLSISITLIGVIATALSKTL